LGARRQRAQAEREAEREPGREALWSLQRSVRFTLGFTLGFTLSARRSCTVADRSSNLQPGSRVDNDLARASGNVRTLS
jgi:hypothetical protein